ncbi:MAG: hypothetical protein SGI72_01095 [Planctomycetota bacterium]|nr:hypothetical protein [Planctomycetota bacterium]
MPIQLTPENTTLCTVTRSSRAEFVESSLLGRSLRNFSDGRLPRVALHADNAPPHAVLGLSEIYNRVLDAAARDSFVVFVHDDVYVNDWFLLERLTEAFEHFDVVGVAGNSAPDFAEPAWCMRFDASLAQNGLQNRASFSGSVRHGDPHAPGVHHYGPAPRACELLDGLFLAVNVRRLREHRVRFDTRFRFHAYDLDLCRTARAADLRVGTWPIALTHASRGSYDSAAWREAAAEYLRKWSTTSTEREASAAYVRR